MNNNNIRTESFRFYVLSNLKNGIDRITANLRNLLIFCFALAALTILSHLVVLSAPDYLYGIYNCSLTILFSVGIMFIFIILGHVKGSLECYKDFLRIGFCNHAREAPVLVKREVHNGTERLTFHSRGITDSEWRDRLDEIQSAMNKTIVRIRPGRTYRTVIVDVVPPSTALGKLILWQDKYMDDDEAIFTLGHSLTGPVTIDIDKQPMLLIGGSTGSGKTMLCITFLLQALRRDGRVYVFDFKGLDYQLLESMDAHIVTSLEILRSELDALVGQLHDRIALFKEIGAFDFKDYQKIDSRSKFRRTFLLIDECAELLDPTGHTKEEKEVIYQITKNLNTIARMGRAVGIHLIISTQRPDANAVPGSIKSNLDVRICGKADATLSTIILGDGRANDAIPKDSQGRFIMADGAEDIIFQGFFYDRSQL